MCVCVGGWVGVRGMGCGAVSKLYPRYVEGGGEGERCGRLIQIRDGRVSKLYPRYVGDGMWSVWYDGKLYPRYVGVSVCVGCDGKPHPRYARAWWGIC